MVTNEHGGGMNEVKRIATGMAVQIVTARIVLDGRQYGQEVIRGTVVDIDPDFGDIIVTRDGEPFHTRIRRERIIAVTDHHPASV